MAGHIHNARRVEQDEGCVAGNDADEAHRRVWLVANQPTAVARGLDQSIGVRVVERHRAKTSEL